MVIRCICDGFAGDRLERVEQKGSLLFVDERSEKVANVVSSRERSGNEKTKQNKTIVKDKIVLSQKTFIS